MPGSRQAIQAPPATPPVYSLLYVVEIVNDQTRWQQGVEWAPEQVSGGGAIPVDCHGGSPDGKPTKHNPVVNTADPFAVYAEDHCSTFGFEARDYEGRARRQLAAVQSAKIAREFQLGEIRTAEGLGNVALIDGIEVGPGGQDVEDAIGELEAALAERFDGARCMIHVTTQTFVEMMRKNLIFLSGQKWLTAPGNIVVADAGYVSEVGADAGVFAYGTSMVQVRLSPVDVIPGSFDEALARAQMTDRAHNSIVIYAERLALIVVDHTDTSPADLVFKVELALPPWHVGS